jgi:membrane protease YdiL (CAAX protease family)
MAGARVRSAVNRLQYVHDAPLDRKLLPHLRKPEVPGSPKIMSELPLTFFGEGSGPSSTEALRSVSNRVRSCRARTPRGGPVGLLIATFLIAYNNLSPWRTGLEYVVANVTMVAALAAIVMGATDLGPEDVGLRGNRRRYVLYSFVAAVLVTAPLYILAAFDTTARFVADERVADLSGSEVAFNMLVRIPLGTALAEELAFRGVLYGVLRRSRTFLYATIGSSLVFGLWHIRPALASIRANLPDAGEATTVLLVLSVVVGTGLAGALFCALREKGGGIGAPWAFHATLNSLALGAAVLAHP